MFRSLATLVVALTAAGATPIFAQETPAQAIDNESLLEIIQRQQQQIDALQQRLDALEHPAPLQADGDQAETTGESAPQADQEIMEILSAQQDEIDELKSEGPARRTHVGGYGELHYNNLDADDPSRDLDEIDFHRFVLFFGHEFNEDMRFFSELELEHSLVEDTDDGSGPGEIEIEQAYVEFDLDDRSRLQTGLFLVPVGLLNETHEPPTFYGVERNTVENIIIPTTWREAGVQYIRDFGQGWQWNIGVHSGLEVPTNSFRVRSGRASAAKANADNFALTSRIKYTGIAGLEIAGSISLQDDPSQSPGDGLDDGILYTAHVAYNHEKFGLRALWAEWDFTGNAVEAAASDADSQSGWYIEPSYRLTEKFGVYARYEDVDAARAQDNFNESQVGFNWWPHRQVVFKFDYRTRDHDLVAESGRDFDGFDVGVGYQF